jgi:serine/threonine protein kinase
VYRALNRHTGEQVAVKVIERSRFLNMSAQRWALQIKEAETLRKLDHKGIVAFRDLIQTDDRLFVVTELLRGGELYERLVCVGAEAVLPAGRRHTDGALQRAWGVSRGPRTNVDEAHRGGGGLPA